MNRSFRMFASLVFAISISSAHAVVLECDVRGELSSWTEHYDTEKEPGWKVNDYDYRKTERFPSGKPGGQYKEQDTRISRHTGKLMIVTTTSDASSVHKVEGDCRALKPEDRKF